MKKWLLLALIACATLGCSKDDKEDNTVRYDEDSGYFTNLASAKHGIDGTWNSLNTYNRNFNTNTKETCTWFSSEPNDGSNCYNYKITKEGNAYYLNTFLKTTGESSSQYEIGVLNKTQLSLIRTDTGASLMYARRSTPPTP